MSRLKITADHLTKLDWIKIPPLELDRVDWTDSTTETDWWRIIAEISCSSCGAFQAADSDPTNDKPLTITLTLGLFNKVGWHVDEHGRTLCSDC